MGYPVLREGAFSAIDQARSQLASNAYLQGYEETMWIDSDIAFEPAAVEMLRSSDEPIVCGVYPVKGKQLLACHTMPGTTQLQLGANGALTEILYAGFGFNLVRRSAYAKIHQTLGLPVCNAQFGYPLIPFFCPMAIETEAGHWYLAEDFAFCHRARQSGLRIMADTRIRLWHIGTQPTGWETNQLDMQRSASYKLSLH